MRCSITHTTNPVKKMKQRVATQRPAVSGFKNIQEPLLMSFLSATIIEIPGSVYENVKST